MRIPTLPVLGPMAVLLCAVSGRLAAQQALVTPLMTKELPDVPGKEATMLLVEYPPGSSDPVHRHNADAFVYLLEGSVVMQVKGQPPVTLTAGQTFYEGPDDVHVVGRNASTTKPARFVVVLVKQKGAPALVPVHDGKWFALPTAASIFRGIVRLMNRGTIQPTRRYRC